MTCCCHKLLWFGIDKIPRQFILSKLAKKKDKSKQNFRWVKNNVRVYLARLVSWDLGHTLHVSCPPPLLLHVSVFLSLKSALYYTQEKEIVSSDEFSRIDHLSFDCLVYICVFPEELLDFQKGKIAILIFCVLGSFSF